jgi:hypothetical protein
MTYRDPVPEITASDEGFVDEDTEDSLTTGPTCATEVTSDSGVGVYETSCSGAEIDGYEIIYV